MATKEQAEKIASGTLTMTMATQAQAEKTEKKPEITVDARHTGGVITDINRVLEIVRTLPTLRRYGGDDQALKDAVALLEKIKERL